MVTRIKNRVTASISLDMGVFFHLCQSVYRAVIRLGLKIDYSGDQTIPAVPFLKVDDVIGTFGKLILLYFEQIYIGKNRRGTQSKQKPEFELVFEDENK